ARQVRHLAVSPDGKRLAAAVVIPAAAGEQGFGGRGPVRQQMEIITYDLAGMNHLFTLRGGPQSDSALKFSPDGRYLFAPEAGGNDRTLLQWDLTTGRGIRQYPVHNGSIHAIAFTPDGKTMLTADDRVHRWDWRTGRGLDATEPIMTDAP